jgi:hypothetical protein
VQGAKCKVGDDFNFQSSKFRKIVLSVTGTVSPTINGLTYPQTKKSGLPCNSGGMLLVL